MKWRRVFGWLPVPIIRVPRLWGGIDSFTPLVLILLVERCWDDEPLIANELTHVEQAYRGLLLIYAVRYLFDREFRLSVELDAYRRQIDAHATPGERAAMLERAAYLLTLPVYRFGIDESTARLLLEAAADNNEQGG